MAPHPLLIFDARALEKPARAVLRRLPPLRGRPIRLQSAPSLRDRYGPVHAGSFLRERRIAFDCDRRDFARILTHELFHFVWLRAGNSTRWSYEDLLRAERLAGARGELGWSAEWRKTRLAPRDVQRRTRRWREYCCESFCDAAACFYSGVRSHPEYTLAGRFLERRRAWFRRAANGRTFSI